MYRVRLNAKFGPAGLTAHSQQKSQTDTLTHS